MFQTTPFIRDTAYLVMLSTEWCYERFRGCYLKLQWRTSRIACIWSLQWDTQSITLSNHAVQRCHLNHPANKDLYLRVHNINLGFFYNYTIIYMYTYIYIYTCVRRNIHTVDFVYIDVSRIYLTHIYIDSHIYIYIYIYIYIHIYIYI